MAENYDLEGALREARGWIADREACSPEASNICDALIDTHAQLLHSEKVQDTYFAERNSARDVCAAACKILQRDHLIEGATKMRERAEKAEAENVALRERVAEINAQANLPVSCERLQDDAEYQKQRLYAIHCAAEKEKVRQRNADLERTVDRLADENRRLREALTWAASTCHVFKTCLCVRCEDARKVVTLPTIRIPATDGRREERRGVERRGYPSPFHIALAYRKRGPDRRSTNPPDAAAGLQAPCEGER